MLILLGIKFRKFSEKIILHTEMHNNQPFFSRDKIKFLINCQKVLIKKKKIHHNEVNFRVKNYVGKVGKPTYILYVVPWDALRSITSSKTSRFPVSRKGSLYPL